MPRPDRKQCVSDQQRIYSYRISISPSPPTSCSCYFFIFFFLAVAGNNPIRFIEPNIDVDLLTLSTVDGLKWADVAQLPGCSFCFSLPFPSCINTSISNVGAYSVTFIKDATHGEEKHQTLLSLFFSSSTLKWKNIKKKGDEDHKE